MSKEDLNWLSLIIAKFIITSKSTLKVAAVKFNRTITEVKQDIERVKSLNPVIYEMVQEVFQDNLSKARF